MRRRLREIYLRPRHVARSLGAEARLIGDEARASKLQLKLSVSIRAHGKVRDTGLRESELLRGKYEFWRVKIGDEEMQKNEKSVQFILLTNLLLFNSQVL